MTRLTVRVTLGGGSAGGRTTRGSRRVDVRIHQSATILNPTIKRKK